MSDIEQIEDLQKRLDLMGIKYHPKAGIKKLTLLLEAALEEPVEDEPVQVASTGTDLQTLKKEQLRLIRVVVHSNDPNRAEYTGDIFTVHNELIGTISKYVPFGNTEGWHIPHALYEAIKDRPIQLFRKKKMPNGLETSEGYITNAFNVTVLDPLTPKELDDLKRRQKERNSVD